LARAYLNSANLLDPVGGNPVKGQFNMLDRELLTTGEAAEYLRVTKIASSNGA
jgi:hypothetical protein